MSSRFTPLTDTLHQYLIENSLREPEILRRLREETSSHPRGGMQICPEQGQFMMLLVELVDAKQTIEIGTFTGYSTLAVALALPGDGRIIACDVSREYTDIARRYWQEAGVADRIDLRLGPAVDTLASLLSEGRAGHFDLAFIDADKENYGAYYERCLDLLRPGGLILIDNVLWRGRVTDPSDRTVDTEAIRDLNRKLLRDDRITMAMLPIGDGLTLARKRRSG